MKYCCLFLSLFLGTCLTAQHTTVIYDGVFGITRNFKNDTTVISKVLRNLPVGLAGIKTGDKIIHVNGIQVSGAGTDYRLTDDLMHQSAGTVMHFGILRNGIDSIIDITLTLSPGISFSHACYYDYLPDPEGHLTIHDILSDSIQKAFSSIIENALIVDTVLLNEQKQIPIFPGDKLISFDIGLYSWFKFRFRDYNDSDTLIRIIRDSVEVFLKTDPAELRKLDIRSKLMRDLEAQTVWCRAIIEPRISQDRMGFIMFRSDFNESASVSVFTKQEDGKIMERRTGNSIPVSERDYLIREMQVARLNIQADRIDTVYFRISTNGPIDSPPYIDIGFLDYSLRFERIDGLIFGITWGMIFLVAVFYLILSILLRERTHLIFSLFTLSYCLLLLFTTGFGAEILWPDKIVIVNRLELLIMAVPFCLFLLFGLSYLKIRSSLKKWYRAIVSIIVFFSIALVIYTIKSARGDLVDFVNMSLFAKVVENIVYILLLIMPFLLIVPAIIKIKRGFRSAWYFLIGNVFLILLIGLFLFREYDIFTSILMMSVRNASLQIGAVLQFLVFSIGLGQGIRDSERKIREAQERIIFQLRENEILKDKVNLELEQKVKERTFEIETQKDRLQEQQKEITDSINYARRIQTAVLPPVEMMNEILPEHFILFKPLDIVSGDFYWIRQLKDFTFVVAADCTGHGVPGALLSMLGISYLNEIVQRRGIARAGPILNELRREIKRSLRQTGDNDETRDGLDIALCIIDNRSNIMQYSGANNPLYIISNTNGESVLKEIKADPMPVGVHFSHDKPFTNHEIRLRKGDAFYIFSDGYADQGGGDNNKRLTTPKFKKLLMEIHHRSMNEQKEILEDTLNNWMGYYPQRDDILVIGVRTV